MSDSIEFHDKVIVLGERKPKKLIRVCTGCQGVATDEVEGIPVCEECWFEIMMFYFIFLIALGAKFVAHNPSYPEDVPFTPTTSPDLNPAFFL